MDPNRQTQTLSVATSSTAGERDVADWVPPFVIVSNFLWRQWGTEGLVHASPGDLSTRSDAIAVVRRSALVEESASPPEPSLELEVRANNFVFLNGRQLYGRSAIHEGDFVRLANGAYLQIGSLTIPTCETEAAFLARIDEAPEDEENRIVYADWLEQQGRHRYAEVLRLDARLFTVPGVWNVISRLQIASRDVPRDWRLRVCRLRTPLCPEARCPKYWHRFQRTDNTRLRECTSCAGRPIGLRVTKAESVQCAWEVEDPAL